MPATASLGSPGNLSDALSEQFENEIVRAINRESLLLSVLPTIRGNGKRSAWDVQGDNTAGGSYAEADDVQEAEYGSEAEIPATLGWGLYRTPFRVTGLAQAAAATTDRPSELQEYWLEKMFGAVSRLGQLINIDLYTGVGANKILGLYATAGALLDTGTYAGIDRSTNTFWQGNVVGNSGTPRPISFSLMREVVREIFIASGREPDLIVTDPIQWDKYAALFDSNRRYTIDTIRTAAGEIKLSGGHRALEFDGRPVLRDKDHPAGKMSFIDTANVRVKFLPTRANQPSTEAEGTFAIHDDRGRVSGLPCRIEHLGKTGDTTKSFAKVYPQLVNRRCNSSGALIDLS